MMTLPLFLLLLRGAAVEMQRGVSFPRGGAQGQTRPREVVPSPGQGAGAPADREEALEVREGPPAGKGEIREGKGETREGKEALPQAQGRGPAGMPEQGREEMPAQGPGEMRGLGQEEMEGAAEGRPRNTSMPA
jgi:hypothetical protein